MIHQSHDDTPVLVFDVDWELEGLEMDGGAISGAGVTCRSGRVRVLPRFKEGPRVGVLLGMGLEEV
jgi:hypothetical protein